MQTTSCSGIGDRSFPKREIYLGHYSTNLKPAYSPNKPQNYALFTRVTRYCGIFH